MSTVQISLPDDVLSEARRLASNDQVALDEFIARAIAEHATSIRRFHYLRERGKGATREKFLAALHKAPDVEPDQSDRLP